MVKLVLFIVLMWAFSCQRHDGPEPDRTDYACGQVVSRKLFNMKGVPINYAKEIDRYYLNIVSDPAPLGRVAVFCSLPEAYKVAGKTIDFDGRFSPINFRDSTGEDARLRRYFSPIMVEHVAVDKIN